MLGLSQVEKCSEVCLEGIRFGRWFGENYGDIVSFVKSKGFDIKIIKKAMLVAIQKNYKNSPGQMKILLEKAQVELDKL